MALINGVTGISDPKATRLRATKKHKLMSTAISAPDNAPKVAVSQFHFFELNEFEGEFKVGLGRVKALKSDSVDVEWCIPKGYHSRDGHVFVWKDNQPFEAYKPTGRLQVTSEKLERILPIEVQLTKGSNHESHLSLGHQDQSFKLLKSCLVTLRLFLQHKMPHLMRAVGHQSGKLAIVARRNRCWVGK